MILVYAHTSSSRLQYTCSFIFKELMGIEYELTIDPEKLRTHAGAKINYSTSRIIKDEFYIQNHNLLFEQDIKVQVIDCFTAQNNKAFFKTPISDLPFDIFAASFYLLSRYEEYLPHEKDMYGRYACENSFAYKNGCLHLPLINLWVMDLARDLRLKFLVINFKLPAFHFLPTYDIDIAYSYKHKGSLRNIGGFFRSPSLERLQVLTGRKKDPFDCYAYLHQLHNKYHLEPIYFFLVAGTNGKFDKNILPHSRAMWDLVGEHAKKYSIGIHPSWQSGDNRALIKKEKVQLEAMSGCAVDKARQHYIRFNLPEGYQRLITSGITDDYSMGYGSTNGFRASVASSFYWYDLEKELQTNLRIHPFCFMDANAYYEQRQKPDVSLEELLHYLTVCIKVNGTLITIWHNNFLGTVDDLQEWKEIYGQFIAQVQQLSFPGYA